MPDTSSVRHNERVTVSKLRNLRVDGELWHLVKLVSDRRRDPLSQIMKRALVEYAEQHATDDEREQAVLLAQEEAARDAKRGK